MRLVQKIALVLAVLALGVCAALPFRKSDSPPTQSAERPAPSSRDSVRLRRQVVPLHVSPQVGTSPVADPLGRSSMSGSEEFPKPPPQILPEDPLDADAPPPELARRYRSYLDPSGLTARDASVFGGTFAKLDETDTEPDAASSAKTPSAELSRHSAPERATDGAHPQRRHRIVDGDTLPELARRYLGSRERYLEIYEANRDVLPGPELLPLGIEIVLPNRESLPREPAGVRVRGPSAEIPFRTPKPGLIPVPPMAVGTD